MSLNAKFTNNTDKVATLLCEGVDRHPQSVNPGAFVTLSIPAGGRNDDDRNNMFYVDGPHTGTLDASVKNEGTADCTLKMLHQADVPIAHDATAALTGVAGPDGIRYGIGFRVIGG